MGSWISFYTGAILSVFSDTLADRSWDNSWQEFEIDGRINIKVTPLNEYTVCKVKVWASRNFLLHPLLIVFGDKLCPPSPVLMPHRMFIHREFLYRIVLQSNAIKSKILSRNPLKRITEPLPSLIRELPRGDSARLTSDNLFSLPLPSHSECHIGSRKANSGSQNMK
jgi:hypothetical protein